MASWGGMDAKQRSAEMRRRIRKAKLNRRTTKQRREEETDVTVSGTEVEVAFAFGYAKAWLEAHAERVGIPGATLAGRVGELLHRSSRRAVLGSHHRVSGMQ